MCVEPCFEVILIGNDGIIKLKVLRDSKWFYSSAFSTCLLHMIEEDDDDLLQIDPPALTNRRD